MAKKKAKKKAVKKKAPKPELPPEQPVEKPNVVKLENRIRKHITFLADAVRDERDREVLNTEIRKRVYKGRIKKVTTIKHYEIVEGHWLTTFEIEVK